MNEPDLIDLFYEAAVIPELWPQAIGTYAETSQAAGAVMFLAAGERSFGLASPSLAEKFGQFAREGGLRENARLTRFHRLNVVEAQRDQDLFSPAEMETLPFYRALGRFGLKWSVAMVQPLPGGDEAVLSLERSDTAEPFDRAAVDTMNRLKPHFARSVLASSRLSREHVVLTLDAFSALDIPAATISHSKRLLDANGPFSALNGLFADRRERLALSDVEADRLLSQAIDRLRSDQWPGVVGSIPVRGDGERGPVVLHLMPMRRAAHDIFSGASALMVVTRVGAGQPLSGPLLKALFDLTPAEARVCEALASGTPPTRIAAQLAITEGTVRGHLKTVFAKCGVNRQAELVALLNASVMPMKA